MDNPIPKFMQSLEGAYFLRRGLFLPDELPILMGNAAAREGLERLGGSIPGVARLTATDDEARVCQLESTMYLRNQLLRDGDWASVAHSLELRTPLVDATLLESLKNCLAQFQRGAGKRMLAYSSSKSLPKEVIDRPKTGFGVPMNQWLTSAPDERNRGGALPVCTAKMPWARRWSRTVADAVWRPNEMTHSRDSMRIERGA